jgi:thiol-disulfide isomerase/thioredoxin
MKTLLLITGIWRAILSIQGEELPFNFELKESNRHYTMVIMNGEERIALDEISLNGDSLIARFPVFDSEIRVHVTENSMTGNFINHSRKANNIIPFHAEPGKNFRFIQNPKPGAKITGRWETDFSPGTADSSKAIGVFEQKNNGAVYGTFLTTSGDYRYLEGSINGDSLFLSSFNGAFVYLFKAKIIGDNMSGNYFSGNHWKEPFTAIKNEQFKLPDPYSVTWLKKGYDKIGFSLPDLEGKAVTMEDERFKNKVVIIQMMGSWCPNCLDESAFFSPVYEKYKSKGLEIVGIAFEKTADFTKAVSLVSRLKEKYHISYPLVIANRDSAAQTLPMLNKINGYPTTIYLDKKGKVRKIYTGFSGPATGKEYEKYKEDFYRLIDMLLSE